MNRYFTNDALLLMRHEIELAGGNEVFFIGRTNLDGIVCEVETIARGSKNAVPAILSRAVGGDVVIHNHPSGDLTPSAADMDIASVAGNQGIGCSIVDNGCTRCYQVVTPFMEKKGELLSLDEISRIFGAEGVLAVNLKGFEQRDEQMRMAFAVCEAFNRNRAILVEAGTGTGKSLAYLIPSILWAVRNNERVVISTNTINLQEQLIRKDLPFLSRHAQVEFKAALIKGRSNYACLRKLENAEAEPSLFPDESASELTAIIEWSKSAGDGCRSDLTFIPHAGTWEEVCCEADQCGRSRCKHFNRCFFYRARREASAARILVVNHALLLSDIVLRSETGYDATAILPPFTRLIFDEGHHLEDVATSHLSQVISRGGILKQLHRLVPAKAARAGLLTIVSNRLARDLPEAQEALYIELSGLLETHLLPKAHDLAARTDATMDWLALAVEQETGSAAGREQKLRITPAVEGKAFWQECRQRLHSLSDAVADYTSALRSLLRRCEALPEKLRERLSDQLVDIAGIEQRLQAVVEGFLFYTAGAEGFCRWIEVKRGSRGLQARLCAAPLDISGQVKQTILDRLKTIVVTSATLTVGGQFEYLKKRTGFGLLETARLDELQLASPFDYGSQVFVAVPDDMPEPTAPGFREALERRVLQAVTISRGGAFILFTSYDLLNKVYTALAPELARLGLTALKQGETGRHALLARFRKEHNAVLFGTDSFWEGVDVKGDALRLVIIARLPFQVPTEPVQQARAEQIQSLGGDPFRDFSIPQAVIKFRQGFGRLIRSRDDRGAVLILDRRVTTKGYGRTFLRSLPDTELVRGESGEVFRRMEGFFNQKSCATEDTEKGR
ncbi:helicase C-terminal domain-containing protein [Geobacter sp. SVR]|uniref:helicase C-terminal domain-containing protein n=1 Tax=Geobacter sp. SVR TaxID=2495594 RepID=UPI00143F0297|nr:helicase C-terminal domain-containing protein [Geobacter sp. SVR]BCS55684.1 ATP-dependent DNA helicase DinG [Geobacter sp. SVR]GCF83688.1 ATP-dependent DNA helicase DinG [Geobacter sp. SVR]